MKASSSILLCLTLATSCANPGDWPPPNNAIDQIDETTTNLVALTEGDDPPINAAAAGSITIVGAVRDREASGKHLPVPGVKVTISGAASGSALTNSDGVYRFQRLPAGSYTMTATRAGATFAPATRTFTATGSMVRGIDCLSGCGPTSATAADFKELVITDRSVTADARASNASAGPWSFRFLIEQMSPAGVDPADFVQTWLNGFLSAAGPINRFAVENRSIDRILDPTFWPRRPADGKLDLGKAPFQLLAIVNRTDLHSAGNGEGRFVFGVKSATSGEQLFTAIFEYRLPTKTSAGAAIPRLTWIKRFHDLAGLSFGSGYNAALQKVTDQFTRAGTTPGAPNGSSISQVRTNEIFLGGPWQLREFHLVPGAGGKALLNLVAPGQTPDESKNGQPDLADYLRTQRVAIIGGFATVPAALTGGQSNENFTPWAFSGAPDIDQQTRKTFAGQTCNGCHNGEAEQLDLFYHVTPNPRSASDGTDRLSPFVTTIEIPRRRRWVAERLSCATDLSNCPSGAEGMVLADFQAAGDK
jgi:hypothetical protein